MASGAAESCRSHGVADAGGWSRRDWVALGGVAAIALLLRLLHLREIAANDPFFANPSLDPRFYHDAAVALSRGEVPDDLSLIPSLYPYFLAAIYAVTGPSFLAAKAVQALLGSVSCGLVYALARRLFDRRVAAVSGGVAALYPMLIFYGGTLTIVNLVVPLTLGVLLCVERGMRRPALGIWVVAGALVGMTALCRPNALLLAGPLALWLGVGLGRDTAPARRIALVAAFCIGVGLPILPAATQASLLSGDWRGGVNFFIGNNPGAVGTFRPPVLRPDMRVDHPITMQREYQRVAEEKVGRPLSPGEISAFWLGLGIEFIREHPAAWLRLEAFKLALFFNAAEPWTVRSHTVSKSFSWVLRLPLPGYGAVAPFALLGIALTRRRWRALMPLYLALATYLVTALLFFVDSRYRLPVVPVLTVFAASAAVACADWLAARRFGAAVGAAVALGALVWVVHWPLIPDNLNVAYYNLGNRYKALEQWDRAIEAYRRSLAGNPRSISTLNNLALAYEGAGRDAEAVVIWRKIDVWAAATGNARYRERATRHLRALGAGRPAPGTAPGPGD